MSQVMNSDHKLQVEVFRQGQELVWTVIVGLSDDPDEGDEVVLCG